MTAATQPQRRDGVVVLGMHRSGTSLATRLVSLVGPSVCRGDDLLAAHAGNARGHWESCSMVRLNDALLARLRATWWCPPETPPPGATGPLAGLAEVAEATLLESHPRPPWVWKDPRTCLLLPFWTAVLGWRAAYVLVVRNPLEVCASLASRSAFSPDLALALWERYLRDALQGAAGSPLLLSSYDEILADPVAWCARVQAFLAAMAIPTRPWSRAAVSSFASDRLRHSVRPWSALSREALLSREQRDLAAAMLESRGEHGRYAPPELPRETPGTQALFHRLRQALPQAGESLESAPAAPPADVLLQRPPRRRFARPPVSVVVTGGGAAELMRSLGALARTLPAGAELIAVGGEPDPWRAPLDHIRYRHLARLGLRSTTAALREGLEAASGELIAVSSGGILHCSRWYETIRAALAGPDVAAAAPVLRVGVGQGVDCYGLRFEDTALNSAWITAAPQVAPQPVPLLAGSFFMIRRELLEAAGGLDAAFGDADAAAAELSVRLWRMGLRCVVTPAARVRCAPRDAASGPEAADFLADRLRLAALHLRGEALRAALDAARGAGGFASASARLLLGDAGTRRAVIDALCPFEADRYFARFPITSGGDDDPGRAGD
ncbi:MAG: hypothetical protein QOF37_841 [Thermoleophilaceae bacterium]|nr:hypothetical protein [Thermoleophilaceae bacterium]